MTTTAHRTNAGEALRAMLPPGADPYATIELACHTAFIARDRHLLPGLFDVVKTDPELAAGLITVLAALVDVDARPADMLSWLGTSRGRLNESARAVAALEEARAEYDDTVPNTLPEVTLESMHALAHAARIAGVLQPCGTLAAYERHRRNDQKPCLRCHKARLIWQNATPEQREWFKTPPMVPGKEYTAPQCGTVAGYDWHSEFGEDPCQPCVLAAAAVLDHKVVRGQIQRPTRRRPQCGSLHGYKLHREAREDVCDDCGAARSSYDAKKWQERKQRTAAEQKPSAEPISPHEETPFADLISEIQEAVSEYQAA